MNSLQPKEVQEDLDIQVKSNGIRSTSDREYFFLWMEHILSTAK